MVRSGPRRMAREACGSQNPRRGTQGGVATVRGTRERGARRYGRESLNPRSKAKGVGVGNVGLVEAVTITSRGEAGLGRGRWVGAIPPRGAGYERVEYAHEPGWLAWEKDPEVHGVEDAVGAVSGGTRWWRRGRGSCSGGGTSTPIVALLVVVLSMARLSAGAVQAQCRRRAGSVQADGGRSGCSVQGYEARWESKRHGREDKGNHRPVAIMINVVIVVLLFHQPTTSETRRHRCETRQRRQPIGHCPIEVAR